MEGGRAGHHSAAASFVLLPWQVLGGQLGLVEVDCGPQRPAFSSGGVFCSPLWVLSAPWSHPGSLRSRSHASHSFLEDKLWRAGGLNAVKPQAGFTVPVWETDPRVQHCRVSDRTRTERRLLTSESPSTLRCCEYFHAFNPNTHPIIETFHLKFFLFIITFKFYFYLFIFLAVCASGHAGS